MSRTYRANYVYLVYLVDTLETTLAINARPYTLVA